MAPAAPARRGGQRRADTSGASHEKQDLVRAINEAVEARDFAALQEIAFLRSGFGSSELRRTVWLCLLGLSHDEVTDASWRRLLAAVDKEGKDAKVIHGDVQRSVYSWDVHTGMRASTRSQKRVVLSEVMHGILQRHAGKLAYFQGFHDVALVFLEVGTPSQALHMVERLALFHLSDQLCWSFDEGLTPLLGVLFGLLEILDKPLAEALFEAECGELHFAVPWVLTWFSHTLPRLQDQVMRLFDCLISSHPAMVLYFCAALLFQHREAILQAPRELPEVVMILQKLPYGDLNVDDWAEQAWHLAQRLPPEELLARVSEEQRSALPPTSPLFHYPHPWMAERRLGGGAAPQLGGNLSELAPMYRNLPDLRSKGGGGRSVLARARGGRRFGDQNFPLLARGILRTLGAGGAVALVCALSAWLLAAKK